jgi:hypothetical protein
MRTWYLIRSVMTLMVAFALTELSLSCAQDRAPLFCAPLGNEHASSLLNPLWVEPAGLPLGNADKVRESA